MTTLPHLIEAQLDEANNAFPVGLKVRYYPIANSPHYEVTKVTSLPWSLGGKIVVKIEGRSGGVSVAHLLPEIEKEQ